MSTGHHLAQTHLCASHALCASRLLCRVVSLYNAYLFETLSRNDASRVVSYAVLSPYITHIYSRLCLVTTRGNKEFYDVRWTSSRANVPMCFARVMRFTSPRYQRIAMTINILCPIYVNTPQASVYNFPINS